MAQDARDPEEALRRHHWIGERVKLRGLRSTDWELFRRWNESPEWSWADLHAYPPISPEQTKSWVEREAREGRDGDNRRFIIESAGGEPVGTIDTSHCNRLVGTFRYGLAIAPEHRRNGYAREAILLVLRFYFEEYGYQKVNTSIWSFNEPSLRMHEALGFTLEGTLRRTHRRAGRLWDEVIVGMTIEEFHERHG
jgi:RimJ/RimL family protein N-acetyltransferase